MARNSGKLWWTLVLALSLSVLLFMWSVVVLPALTGETRSRRLVLYWAVASPIAGVLAAVTIRGIGRRLARRIPTRPRSTRWIVLNALLIGIPGALGIMLLLVIPPEISPSELVWWRITEWIAIFVGLTVAIGFLGGAFPELVARWATGKRTTRQDEDDSQR